MISSRVRFTVVVWLVGVSSAALAAEKPPTQAVLEYLGNRAARMVDKTAPPAPDDVQTWQQRRKLVRESLSKILGLPYREAMRAKVTAVRQDGDLIVEEVMYLWAERAYTTAKVVRPKDAKGRLPAIVSPPGWLGTLELEYYKSWVYHMAGKGYLVLFIDDPHVGKRKAGYAALYGLASAAGTPVMGVQVFDVLRGLDYLLTRPDVDPGRIGISGLCQGAEQTWLAAALEDRFQVTVPVCGTTTYKCWARMPHFLGVALSDPSPYVENVLRHTEWDEIGACIAPRPLLIASNAGDNWWPKQGFDKVVDRLEKTYRLYKKPRHIEVVFDLRSHSMAPYAKEIAAWFDCHLLPLPKSDAAPQTCGEVENPDTNMVRYFQRRIAAQTAKLPQSFDSLDAWNAYRDEMLRWLRRACSVDELKPGEAKTAGTKNENGLVVETVYLPQDEGFACPVAVYRKDGGPRQLLPGMVLSHHGGGCIADEAVKKLAVALAGDGWLVALPEHAGLARGSLRPAASNGLVSLYGVADSVGLPPMAMRVWDDLSCVAYLSGRPDVDKRRILAAGMGEGGLDAAIAAALDNRIAGLGLIGPNTVQDWAEQTAPKLHQFDRVMPYLPSITKKTDLQYIYAAVAPRPLLLVDINHRDGRPEAAFQRVYRQAKQIFTLYGASEKLTSTRAKSPWGFEELRRWTSGQAGQTSDQRKPLFSPEEVAAYKPKDVAKCFRQLCYDYNWVGRRLADLPNKFTQADPTELAEFSKKLNLDAVLLLAVPHHGYCTYETKVGMKFPGIRGDWFGRCIQELHKRDIAALGYITLGHNWKFMRDHYGQPFVHSGMDADGVLEGRLCLNAPGYLELVEAYTRELLTLYPVDALRYDMLFSAKRCLCAGCKSYYKELYGEELTTWEKKDWRRSMDFYMATLARAVNRLTETARATKPSVQIWLNHVNTYSEADVNLGRQHDVAYIEFGDPVRLLALKGILNKDAIIVGQTLNSPIRRTIMALGARCYQYVPVNQQTALPDKREWLENDLAPFFQMVSEVQSYLDGARTLTTVGLVFSENTRFRFKNYDRDPYMKIYGLITGAYLNRSIPLDFVNCPDLPVRDLSRYRLLVLPETSGLASDELAALRRYVRAGGNLLVAGDALRHDSRGMPQQNFSLSDCMGLRFEAVHKSREDLNVVEDQWAGGSVPKTIRVHKCVFTRPMQGKTLLHVANNGKQYPLLHTNRDGQGRIVYLSTLDSLLLTRQAIDWIAGPAPMQVFPSGKQLILTRQDSQNRWILHVLDSGDYIVNIRRDFAAPSKVISLYPQHGWDVEVKRSQAGAQLIITGDAPNRLVVLQ